LDTNQLINEINAEPGIAANCTSVINIVDNVDISFDGTLNSGEQTLMDSVIAAHSGPGSNTNDPETIDHANVLINAGTGLSGGGDLTTSRTLNINIPGLTAESTVDPAADYLMMYDASVAAHRKVLISNISGSTSTTPIVQARCTTSFSITTNWNAIVFDTTDIENDDTVIEHDNSNKDRINMLESGLFEVYYHVDAVTTGGGNFTDIESRVLINGTTVLDGSEAYGTSYGSGLISASASRSIVADFNANDYVQVQVQWDTGGFSGNVEFDPTFRVRRMEYVGAQGPQGPPGAPGTGNGDVAGAASSIDKGLVRFNGTTGKIIEGVGLRHYGASATDPVSPPPSPGDKYYNTVINHEMCYDGTRSKWLSIAILVEGSGVNGTVSANTYFRRFNGMTMSATNGPSVPKGTIIGIGYSQDSSVSFTFSVVVNGVEVSTLASGGSTQVSNYNLNNDFAAGIMATRNQSGGFTITRPQATVYYKLRV